MVEGISSGVSSKVFAGDTSWVATGGREDVSGLEGGMLGVTGSAARGGVGVELSEGEGNWPRSSFDMMNLVWQKRMFVSTKVNFVEIIKNPPGGGWVIV